METGDRKQTTVNKFKSFFENIAHHVAAAFQWLGSDKAKAAFDQAATVVEHAAPIVQTIGELVPTGAIGEVADAYLKFGVPFAEEEIQSGPYAVGNSLLNLATGEVKKLFPNIPINIIQTGVQMAVTAYRANHPTTPASTQ